MRTWAPTLLVIAVWAGPLWPADTSSAVHPELSCQPDGAQVSCSLALRSDDGAPAVGRLELESREVVVVRDRRGVSLRGRRPDRRWLALTPQPTARFVLAMPRGEAATELRVVVRGAGSILATERWFLSADAGAGLRLTRNHPALLASPVPMHRVAFTAPPEQP